MSVFKGFLCAAMLFGVGACGQWPSDDTPSKPHLSHSPSSDLFVESDHDEKYSGVIENVMEYLRWDREDEDYVFGAPTPPS